MTDTASTAYATSIKMGWQPAEIVNPPVTVAVITVAKIVAGDRIRSLWIPLCLVPIILDVSGAEESNELVLRL